MQIPKQVLADIVESSKLHARLIQNINLQGYMQRVYDAVDKYNRILIFSPHSVGKTHGLSGLVTKLLTCHPATSIITTAPTHRQVEDLLWKEIAARYNSMPPEWQLGKLSKTKWEIERPNQKFKWFAKGFSVQKSATTDRGQGKN